MNMELLLKKIKSKHLNGIKDQLNRNTVMHEINLDFFMKMVGVQKKILKKLFIGTKKQQKMEINLHSIIWVYVINMEMVLKVMNLKHLNGIENLLNKGIMMLKTN